jgi:hypothetical protein
MDLYQNGLLLRTARDLDIVVLLEICSRENRRQSNCMELGFWEVREPEISCASTLYQLASSGDFPLCRVVFSATTAENRLNTPKVAPLALF